MESWFERLKRRRKKLSLSQADIRRAIGVSNYTVSSWESGKHKPEGENLIALCGVLQCSPDWLMRGKEPHTTGHGEMLPSEARLAAKMPPLKSHIAASSHDEPVSQIPFDPTGLSDSQRELFEAIIQSLPTMDDETAGALKTIAMKSSKTKSRK